MFELIITYIYIAIITAFLSGIINQNKQWFLVAIFWPLYLARMLLVDILKMR